VNYYRTFVRNWEATAGRSDFTIKVPSMFLAGEKDGVIRGAAREALSDMMAPLFADLRAVTLVPEVGHWVQQEAPDDTNAALLAFLRACLTGWSAGWVGQSVVVRSIGTSK
tara:strand:+ start:60 stop:392 length:333 start_codon:yes stop_codon:yes gene_type:complete